MRGPNGVVVATAGAGGFRRDAAMRASACEAAMADHIGFERRNLDLVVFADQLSLGIRGKRAAARRADAPAYGRELRQDRRRAGGYAAHARTSPRRGASSRASPSCPSRAASTNCARSCPAAGAAAPTRSTRPCSAAANQSGPSPHGFTTFRRPIGGQLPKSSGRVKNAQLYKSSPRSLLNYARQ